MALQAFEKWAVNFVCLINPLGKKTGARYIITAIDYVTCWEEAQAVRDCTAETIAHFIFEHILTRFGCPKVLMSDCSTHFVNETIHTLREEFQIDHTKSTPYHLQANGAVESFNKILEKPLTKVYNSDRSNWDA